MAVADACHERYRPKGPLVFNPPAVMLSARLLTGKSMPPEHERPPRGRSTAAPVTSQAVGTPRSSSRGIDGERDGRGALVVGEVDDDVGIAVAEGEVEALELPADALGDPSHGIASAASARALDALDALERVRGLEQELGHRALLSEFPQPSHPTGRGARKPRVRG
jgi:hypothetical protein